MQISIENQQDDLAIDEELIRSVAKAVIANEGQRADELSLQFVTTPQICELHEQFFDDPTTTDCISFPMDPPDEPGYRVIGEVFVCPETAIAYCRTHGGDAQREMILYVVHGLLHLMGYDDIEEEERHNMRLAEARHLAALEELGLLPRELL